jgi:hypothetical protein
LSLHLVGRHRKTDSGFELGIIKPYHFRVAENSCLVVSRRCLKLT